MCVAVLRPKSTGWCLELRHRRCDVTGSYVDPSIRLNRVTQLPECDLWRRMTVDVEYLKTNVDLRTLVETDLGKPVSKGIRAWTWKFPFHHEHKGAALAVWKDCWH